MTALHPRHLSQAEQNAREYRIHCIVAQTGRGADRASLQRQQYADDEIDEAFERFVKESPEVKNVERDSRIAGFVSRFEPGAGA